MQTEQTLGHAHPAGRPARSPLLLPTACVFRMPRQGVRDRYPEPGRLVLSRQMHRPMECRLNRCAGQRRGGCAYRVRRLPFRDCCQLTTGILKASGRIPWKRSHSSIAAAWTSQIRGASARGMAMSARTTSGRDGDDAREGHTFLWAQRSRRLPGKICFGSSCRDIYTVRRSGRRKGRRLACPASHAERGTDCLMAFCNVAWYRRAAVRAAR